MGGAATGGILHYDLYGDYGANVEFDLLHVEPIRARSGANDWRIPPHAHPEHIQLLLVRQGGGSIRMEDRLWSVPRPALLVVPAGIVHQIEFQPGTDGYVVTAALGCLKAAIQSDGDLSEAIHPAVYALADSGAELLALEDTFEGLQREFGSSAPGRRAAILAQFSRILVSILRLSVAEETGKFRADRDYELTMRYRALLERHFRSRRSIGFYAGQLAVTPARLNAACKARAGRTASALLYERILVEAKRYLLYTESSVAQVAHLTGFDDPAYFNRFFRRRVGRSPGAFRRSAEG